MLYVADLTDLGSTWVKSNVGLSLGFTILDFALVHMECMFSGLHIEFWGGTVEVWGRAVGGTGSWQSEHWDIWKLVLMGEGLTGSDIGSGVGNYKC